MQKVHHHVEQLVGVMDDQILLPDGGKTIAAVIADSFGIARRIGYEFKIRAVEARELRHLVERQHPIDLEHDVVAGAERALHEALQFRRHIRFDVKPDHRSAAAAFERRLEQPHQILGFFENFQFRVADDTKRADAFHHIAGKQFVDEKAGRAFDRDQPHLAIAGVLRQPHEPLDAVGHADERVHRSAVLGAGKLQRDREAEIGNERERVRRIDRERREQREDVREEIIFKPSPLRLGDVGAVDEDDAGLAERRAQLEPLFLLIAHQEHDRFGNAHQLLGRRQTLGTFSGDAGAHLRPQTGHPHHEEFVEVVGRDRQEPQPLKQRVLAVGGFLENATIEIEPRQLPVDEPFRAGGEFGCCMAFRPPCKPLGGFQALRRTMVECDRGRLATISHDCSLFLELHTRRPGAVDLKFLHTLPHAR